MAKIIKISPIKKSYPDNFKSQDSALAQHGFVRSPGTYTRLSIGRDVTGKYITGLDKEAGYIKRLPAEEREAELEHIDNLLEKLSYQFPGIDFGPRSSVWKTYENLDGDGNQPEGIVKASIVRIGNTPVVLNIDTNPQHLLDYCWLRVDKRIAKSLESYHSRKDDPNCQYYIENEEIETRVLYQKKKDINDAITQFVALSPTKKKWVAKSLGLLITDDSTEEFIYNKIDDVLKQKTFSHGDLEGRSTILEFKAIMNLSDERLETKSLLVDALRFNIYRLGEGGVIYQGSDQIAADKDAAVNYLLNDKNQKARIVVEERIKAKKLDLV